MTRTPHLNKSEQKKGAWSEDEDNKLKAYIQRYGHWNWSEIPRFAGVSRCGKSCRLRWMNYLRPNMKHGNFTKEEEDLIIELHGKIGNKWSAIAAKLQGRSDNEIKNYWNTNLRKRIKLDQNVSDGTMKPKKAKHEENLDEKLDKEVPKEAEILSATSSSGSLYVNTYSHPNVTQSTDSLSTSPSSSSSSSTLTTSDELSPSSFFNGFETFASYGDSILSSGYETVGSFWTDPFLTEFDSLRTNDFSSSFHLAQSSSNGMIMDDEFLSSTMDLYYGYHSQLLK